MGVVKNRSPRSSRTSMQLPGFAKFGRSVPTRWAMKVACFLASRLEAQSCPNTSRADISPTKSKKNLCMINVTNPRATCSHQQRVLGRPRMIGAEEREHKLVSSERQSRLRQKAGRQRRWTRPKIRATKAKVAIVQANATSAMVLLVTLDATPTPVTGSALPAKQQTK